ncbi:hypothetical protein [Streptosporangium saharense]|uniref:hypothetical protein n=1 Tax=Streptosporangium saharense TaxID=1706840 RepID=UPI003436F449
MQGVVAEAAAGDVAEQPSCGRPHALAGQGGAEALDGGRQPSASRPRRPLAARLMKEPMSPAGSA